jgi:hypothetical protein
VGVVDISTKVVADAAGAALASCGIPAGADVIEPVLRGLLQVQDEQAQAIARVDANVQRLIDGPWQTARDYIEEASLPMVTAEQREEKLRNASEELHRAIPLQPDGSLRRAYACMDLALVERLLGDAGSSALQARRSVDAAATHVINELETMKKARDAKRRDLKASVATSLAWPAAARAAFKMHALRGGFPVLWHEYGELHQAASALCGADDPGIEQTAEHVTVKINEMKLGEVVEKLGAVSV